MLCRFAPSVAMVQASEPWHRYHACPGRRPLLYWPLVRRVLVQRNVNVILVMIPDVVTDDPAEMLFIQRDDVIEDLAAAAPDPSFRGSVLATALGRSCVSASAR